MEDTTDRILRLGFGGLFCGCSVFCSNTFAFATFCRRGLTTLLAFFAVSRLRRFLDNLLLLRSPIPREVLRNRARNPKSQPAALVLAPDSPVTVLHYGELAEPSLTKNCPSGFNRCTHSRRLEYHYIIWCGGAVSPVSSSTLGSTRRATRSSSSSTSCLPSVAADHDLSGWMRGMVGR